MLLATMSMSSSGVASTPQRRYGEAGSLLREHRTALDAVAAALLEREVLTGVDVEAIVQAVAPPPDRGS
ncbi:hypothetical protein [Roseomonas elaeocarpi]|uniref:Peptidase M41 domain-containing protein n=1 Tax=Roseomonas elaeocarpi TaxID=907779 RepID=A0ABV6JNE7_9PROT